ncbi:MAG: hypothetical protein F8N36_13610 [Desulfovibrio sp.]|nr:hypothetical protein [Desulfovibrio sp.]
MSVTFENANNIASELLNHGASTELVVHMTRLKRADVQCMRGSGPNNPADARPGQVEDFLARYGAIDNLTVDVPRFISAISITGLPPDPAFKALRQAMWQKIEQGREAGTTSGKC